MKNLFLLLLSVASFSANADYITMDVGQSKALPSCGGTISTKVANNELKLTFSRVRECSNFDVLSSGRYLDNYRKTKLDGENQNRSGVFYIATNLFGSGWKSATVQVNSNSGKHGDVITIYYRVTRTPSKITLSDCGGTVEAKQTDDQLNLIFRNVQNCSNFDIVKANGEIVDDYKSKKIPGENGNRGGSFTIPARYIGYGTNTIKINVKSNSGAHSDTFKVTFYN